MTNVKQRTKTSISHYKNYYIKKVILRFYFLFLIKSNWSTTTRESNRKILHFHPLSWYSTLLTWLSNNFTNLSSTNTLWILHYLICLMWFIINHKKLGLIYFKLVLNDIILYYKTYILRDWRNRRDSKIEFF